MPKSSWMVWKMKMWRELLRKVRIGLRRRRLFDREGEGDQLLEVGGRYGFNNLSRSAGVSAAPRRLASRRYAGMSGGLTRGIASKRAGKNQIYKE